MSKKKEQKEPAPAKKKEQKIVYIDDGSTVADMSGTYKNGKAPPPRSTFRERARTFFTAMKHMVIPLIITLIGLTLVYIIVLFAAGRI